MELAARTAAWAKSGGGIPTARDYVQDGLIAMWDGIENAGWGVHDPNATVWKDLVDGDEWTLNTGEFRDDHLYCSGQSYAASGASDTGALKTWNFMDVSFSPDRVSGTQTVIMTARTSWRSSSSLLLNGKVICFGYSVGFGSALSAQVSGRYTIAYKYVESVSSADYWFANGVEYANDHSGATFNQAGQGVPCLGARIGEDRAFKGRVFAIRLYSRLLTSAEIAANYAIDKARFNLPG